MSMFEPRPDEDVIILEIDDTEDSGDPVQWERIGRPYEAIHGDLTERFKDTDVTRLNRIDKAEHLADVARSVYCEQFHAWGLLRHMRDLLGNIDVDAVVTIKVLKVTAAEWAEAEKRGEDEA